ncbi:hypothetical protein [Actinoplanes sp. L3-i22]|uniref:Rv0361 family membrane protein n=1 Tax=Actinoplanes sp. L3-i22 TaxID=2836373 RepID=UPI001C77C426|nr:hypothetical protein [Actinoplanes sp. L3-i22]BCY06268.1 hypothetical protein L3i22_013560 [Actinoplanes sp. L3-i22]
MTYGQPPMQYGPPPPPPATFVPPPPPGPGVHPPFPAPPVEGRGRRIGLGFGIGGGIVALICGGGLAAIIGLGLSLNGSINEQAHAAVADYLDAVKSGNYDEAYGHLCRSTRARESLSEFSGRVAQEEKFTSYTIGDLNLSTGEVPVDLVYADGDVNHTEAQLGQNRTTGEFEVCSLGE